MIWELFCSTFSGLFSWLLGAISALAAVAGVVFIILLVVGLLSQNGLMNGGRNETNFRAKNSRN